MHLGAKKAGEGRGGGGGSGEEGREKNGGEFIDSCILFFSAYNGVHFQCIHLRKCEKADR